MRIIRYEFKYFITTEQYREIMGCISRHLIPDPYARDCPGYRYMVNSLYLDSPSRLYYDEKMAGIQYRRKIRMRCYSADFFNADYYFAEIKKRDMFHIDKLRMKLKNGDFQNYLERQFLNLSPAFMDDSHPDHAIARELIYYTNRHILEPRTFILYEREAYIAENDDTIRVTFDRSIMSQSFYSGLSRDLTGWTLIFPGKTVLEIKVRTFLPFWLHEMVKELGLDFEAISKYCSGVDRAAAFCQ
ncbi:MAG TPA: polyphosphate polymerase domain-containing protein [bacterium]|nr:polyphosphate polymerase domain-containing protein [bacterium]